MAKDKAAVILTIKKPGLMHEQGRKDIGKWLRHQARCFEKHGAEYSDTRFVARYLYSEAESCE